MMTDRAIAALVLFFSATGIFGGLTWWLLTFIEELKGIHFELTERNRLTRERWDGDYKEGRIEKPIKMRA